jgi:hypothetical protein
MTRLPALLALILLLPAACTATDQATRPTGAGAGADASPSTVDDSSVTLGLGQSARLGDGSRLSYTSLVNDSRCAPDVQCVWAGDAEIAVRWKPVHGSSQDLRLHTNRQGGATSARIGERTLTLVSLERGIGPAATFAITAAR